VFRTTRSRRRAPWIITLVDESHRLKMAASHPALPPLLKRERSLCSAIADLSTTSAPFEDPFSADMAAFTEQFLVHGFETQVFPVSFGGVVTLPSPTVHSLPPASTLNATPSSAASQHSSKFLLVEQVANTLCVFPPQTHSARSSSEVSLASTARTGSSCDDCNAPAIAHATLDANTSCSESDTEQQSDATFEGTSSAPMGAGSAPRSRWTTQERSLFLETLAALDTSHSSSTHDARNVAETVALVVATRSAREVQSHARRAIRRLRASAKSARVSARIKTLERCF